MPEWIKIKYTTEDENSACLVWYIIAILIATPPLILSIIGGIKESNGIIYIVGLIISLLIGGLIALVGRNQRKDCSLYINAHYRIMAQGKMYIGQVTDLKEHYDRIRTRYGARTIITYSYIVKYTTDTGEEKIHDTYIVINTDRNAVGKKCVVYDADGKVIVDAIEK
jgi:hypothetical protein